MSADSTGITPSQIINQYHLIVIVKAERGKTITSIQLIMYLLHEHYGPAATKFALNFQVF